MIRSGTLRLDSIGEDYSTYLDSDGCEVWLQHGTAKRLRMLEDLDIADLWTDFFSQHYSDHLAAVVQSMFTDHLASMVIDPEELDDYGFCVNCTGPPIHDDDSSYAGDGGRLCDSCRGEYWLCAHCDEVYRETTTVGGDTEVCSSCLGDLYSWCEACDAYYPDTEGHVHETDCDCDPVGVVFSVPNGSGSLLSDSMTTVPLPAGVISEEGIDQIANLLRLRANDLDAKDLRDHWEVISDMQREASRLRSLACDLVVIGDQWQTKMGNYPKRLSRHAYKQHGLSLPPEVLTEVGNIARAHSSDGQDEYLISVTRQLNMEPGEFAHSGSCWWGECNESRCALKSNGGFGLRAFHPDSGAVEGRCWVMPMRWDEVAMRLTPTFDALTADGYVVFNAYGTLRSLNGVRVLSAMTGLSYRQVTFCCSPMYVNGESGTFVARQSLIEAVGHDLSFSLDQHTNLYQHEQLTNVTEKEFNHV